MQYIHKPLVNILTDTMHSIMSKFFIFSYGDMMNFVCTIPIYIKSLEILITKKR
jgi:hypothetical protein